MDMLELKGSRLVVHLPEEVDHHSTEELVERQPVEEVEFDFSRTAFMDSAGIGMLLGRYKVMRALNGRIMVSHIDRQIRRILSMSGIQKFIQM